MKTAEGNLDEILFQKGVEAGRRLERERLAQLVSEEGQKALIAILVGMRDQS